MGAGLKVLGGLILIIIGLYLFATETHVAGYTIQWLKNFGITLTGIIPIFLILAGLFVAWLEIDEIKTQKELATETKKAPSAQASKEKNKKT